MHQMDSDAVVPNQNRSHFHPPPSIAHIVAAQRLRGLNGSEMENHGVDQFGGVQSAERGAIQWLLNDLLATTAETKHLADHEKAPDVWHCFVAQLEAIGLWQWAIYIALAAQKKGAQFGGCLDFQTMAYLILQRNINRPIPAGTVYGGGAARRSEKMEIDGDAKNERRARGQHRRFCDVSERFYRNILAKKKWTERLEASTIEGLTFLVHIKVPEHWVIHCLAEYAESCSLWTVAFVSFKDCAAWNKVHCILMEHLFMDWVLDDRIEEMLEPTLSTLERHRQCIAEWRRSGMVLLEYIRLIRDIESTPNVLDVDGERLDAVKKGIDEMLDELDGGAEPESDVFERDEPELEEQEMKKRVCLRTMRQRLETCAVHLSRHRQRR